MTIAEVRRLLWRNRVRAELLAALAADPRQGVRDLLSAYRKRAIERARERRRLRRLYAHEIGIARAGALLVGGVDEVGRGPLAGPVVAACVILPERPKLLGLDDSKLLSAAQRGRLEREIRSRALGVGVGVVPSGEIDDENIYQASLRAMAMAIEACAPARPAHLLLDAVRLKGHPLPQEALIGGDGRCACIAAASIIAKEARDRMMAELDVHYPGYAFSVHKGYGTELHLERLHRLGPSPVHRRSFAPVRDLKAALDLARFRQALVDARAPAELNAAWNALSHDSLASELRANLDAARCERLRELTDEVRLRAAAEEADLADADDEEDDTDDAGGDPPGDGEESADAV